MLRLIQSPTTTGPRHAPAVRCLGGLMGGPVLLRRRRRRRLTQHALLVSFPLPPRFLSSPSVNSSTGFDIWMIRLVAN